MYLLNYSFTLLTLLAGIHAVSIDLSDYADGSSANSYATCELINAGDCCALTNGDTTKFASVIFRGLTNLQVGGAYGNLPANSCSGDPCDSGVGNGISNMFACGQGSIYGGKWADSGRAPASAMASKVAGAAHAKQKLREAPHGSNFKGVKTHGSRKGTPGRRSLDSNEDPPRNVVGAGPRQRPGATPTDRPRIIGAVPHDRPQNGGQIIGAIPHDSSSYDGPKIIGAVPHDSSSYDPPWQDDSAGGNANSPWWQWFRGWGLEKAKREVGKTVTPNRITIGGHKFDVAAMPQELRAEIFEALFNRTRFEDLAAGLLAFEMEE